MKRKNKSRISPLARENVSLETDYTKKLVAKHGDVFCCSAEGVFYCFTGESAVWVHNTFNLAYCGPGTGIHARVGVHLNSIDEMLVKFCSDGKIVIVRGQDENSSMKKQRLSKESGTSRRVLRSISSINTIGLLRGEPIVVIFAFDDERALVTFHTDKGIFETKVLDGEDVDEEMCRELLRIDPREILVSNEETEWVKTVRKFLPRCIVRTVVMSEDLVSCRKTLTEAGIESSERDIDAIPLCALYSWLKILKQENRLTSIESTPMESDSRRRLVLDTETMMNLSLVETRGRERTATTMFAVLNRCRTAAGEALLRARLCVPSADAEEIAGWLSELDAYREYEDLDVLIDAIPKTATRLEDGLRRVRRARGQLEKIIPTTESLVGWRRALQTMVEDLQAFARLVEHMACPTCARLPQRDAVTRCYEAVRGELGAVEAWLSEYEDTESEAESEASLSALKAWRAELARQNPTKDVSRIELVSVRRRLSYAVPRDLLPMKGMDKALLMSQTKTQNRYVDKALQAVQAQTAISSVEQLGRECASLRELIRGFDDGMLAQCIESVGVIDLLSSVAQLSLERSLCRPGFTEETEWDLRDVRLPSELLWVEGDDFPQKGHDLEWGDENRVVLLTGPNGSGKSSLMRAVAVNQILAQCGMYCYASSFRTQVVEVFGMRFGTTDNLLTKTSSFEQELRQADRLCRSVKNTPRSLLFFDEFGQCTSSSSGRRLADATVRYLAQCGGKVVFASHYKNLAKCEGVAPYVMHTNKNATNVREYYEYQMRRGVAESSDALRVARMVGLPSAIVQRATSLMAGMTV